MTRYDYLCIGHVTRDLTPGGAVEGGTVIYSAMTSRALGMRTAVVTSAESGYDFKKVIGDVDVAFRPAKATTTFENIYKADKRRQIIHVLAEPLGPEAVPPNWRSPAIVHLGPVANEVDPQLVHLFNSEIIGLTPQGWHRRWDTKGRVAFTARSDLGEILSLATAVIVSDEDILDDKTWRIYRRNCRLMVITQGVEGCIVRHRGREKRFPSLRIPEKDPTGAGDIFAAAFFIKLLESGGDPWEAARFATQVAGPSVRRTGLQSIPTRDEISAARAQGSNQR